MFMFWSKRTVLTKRLLKAKVRGEHETECEAQENLFISNGNSTELRGSCCFSVGNTVDGCDNTSSGTSETRTRSSNDCSPRRNDNHPNRNRNDSTASNSTTVNKRDKDNVVDSESSRIVRLKELLKTLKENQLEMLLTAVESYGADLSSCVLVPRRSGGRDSTNDDNNDRWQRGNDDGDRVSNENLDNDPYTTTMPAPHQRDLNRHANCFNHHQHHHHRTRHHLYHHHHRQLLIERQQQQQQQHQQQQQRQQQQLQQQQQHESSSLAFEERLAASPTNDVTTDTTPATTNNRHGWSDRGRGKSFSSVFGPAPTSNATTDLSHLDPHLLCCQIWRWPDLVQSSELKRLPVCHSAKDPVYVCCNPYHWSRLCKPESPPPPYCLNADRLRPEDRAPSERDSHRYANINSHQPFPGSLTTNDEGLTGQREWCTLAYWELGGRVGRLYPVEPDTVNVFDSLLDGDGLCLANLAENHTTSAAVQRTRNKIGLGLMLSQESDGVWAYNRSENPIFVNSPTLDDPESRTLLVYRVPPGFCLNIFDRTKSMQLPQNSTTTMPTGLESSGPVDVNSVRISFAKGWGPKYSRQEVTSCPCWLEVLLAPCR